MLNLTILLEVFYAVPFIPLFTNEWDKLSTVYIEGKCH